MTHARDEARKLKMRETVTVIVHGGTYVLSQPLELGAADSGTWQATKDEDVRISGGPTIAAAAFTTVTNEKLLSRLLPTARGKVVQANLNRLGGLNLGEFPDSFRGVPAAPELFFNDQRMTLARWPNTGWAIIDKIVESGSVPREGDTSGKPGVFQYSGDEPSRWNVDAGVWLLGYWCFDWYDQAIRVKSIDRERRQITLAAPALYGVKQGNPSPRRFRAINLLDELDEPGEFYIDRATRTLYFWPPGPMDKARITFSTLNAPLIRVKDAQHLTIRGMIFEATLGDGIQIAGGEDIRIEHCTIRNVRQLGISAIGGKGHHIDHCEIYDTGTGGIVLEGGDRKTLTPAGHEATNNRIRDFSRHQQTGAYGITLGGVRNRAAHNLVERAPHQAIFIGGNDHVIEYNIIRNVVTETDDAGAVYKGRNPSCRGNVIRYNFFSDIGSPMGHGTAAIYFDDGDGGDMVFGNIFVRCGQPGRGSFGTVFSHGGHGIHAENNIFIDCKRALGSAPWDDARWKKALAGGEECYFPRKLLEEVDITKPPYTTRYPELIGFMNPKPGIPRVSFAKNNVLVRADEISSGNWTY
ncbi:MAG TPA: right-handed parallel beta-helix repeat-containing protein [Tepidisphaeraceae bacterium]|nr:right-handed parallel beta-helix repeat-containing protein [Tepidisphaeraceae bacterium]